jgi:hypothetical protein
MRLAGILGRIIKAGWLEYPRPGAAPELSRSGLRHQQRHSACGQALVRERGRYLHHAECGTCPGSGLGKKNVPEDRSRGRRQDRPESAEPDRW